MRRSTLLTTVLSATVMSLTACSGSSHHNTTASITPTTTKGAASNPTKSSANSSPTTSKNSTDDSTDHTTNEVSVGHIPTNVSHDATVLSSNSSQARLSIGSSTILTLASAPTPSDSLEDRCAMTAQEIAAGSDGSTPPTHHITTVKNVKVCTITASGSPKGQQNMDGSTKFYDLEAKGVDYTIMNQNLDSSGKDTDADSIYQQVLTALNK